MQKIIFFVTIFLISTIKVSAQIELEWVKSSGGMDTDYGNSIQVDSNKNVFIAGQFRGSVSFDPNSNNYDFTAGQFGDVFIQKLDENGNFLWAKVFQSNDFPETPIIAIDDNNDIYITSTFVDSIDLDPGIAEDIHSSTDPGDNAYIVKLDTNGNYVWGNTFENVSANQLIIPSEIAVDNNGDVLITGQFQTTVDFDYSSNTSNVTALGLDGFLLKIDTNGNFVWVKQFTGAFANFHFSCLAFDTQNNIIAGGAFKGNAPTDFDPGTGVFNMTTPDVNNNDLFILKLTEDGDFIWAKKAEGYSEGINTRGDDRVHSIVIDKFDNILFSGGFRNHINFDPSSTTFILDSGINGCPNCVEFMTGFIAKMDENGTMVWAKKIEGNNFAGSIGNSYYFKSYITLGINENQDLVFGYTYRGTLEYTINNVPFTITTTNINRLRIAYCQVDPINGDFLSVHPVNNENDSFVSNIELVDNELFSIGGYTGELFFDSTTSITSLETSSGGFTRDVYTAKYLLPSLSLNEYDYSNVSMYPNPAENHLNISSNSLINSVLIYDLNGRLLKSIKLIDATLEFQLNTSDLSNGVYFLEINSGKFKNTKKFIKE